MPIKDITVERELHCRDGLDDDAVSRYAEMLDQLPAIKVVRDGDTWLLASGHHRLKAYTTAGKDTIPVEVTDGSRLDALKIGLTENALHGVPLTRKERNRAILRLV